MKTAANEFHKKPHPPAAPAAPIRDIVRSYNVHNSTIAKLAPVTNIPSIRITLQMLHDSVTKFPSQIKQTEANQSFYLAVAILKHFFGEEWVYRYFGNRGYLQIDESGDQTKMDASGLRIIDLAEVIYNLQTVTGFDNCIARMRDGDIEGTAGRVRPWPDVVPQSGRVPLCRSAGRQGEGL